MTAARKSLWAWAVATFFGAGFLKPGPGTYASAITALLWLFAAFLLHHNTQHLLLATLLALALSIALGIPAATRVARESQRKDPGFVVIDEVAGQLIALLALTPDWPHALLALLLFRFFDILKPPPIRRLEALPEGTGIVVDDLAAGVYALLLVQLISHLLRHH
jgi:phosphatidylglycerophosphatase A